MATKYIKSTNKLNKAEQKTTAAFKLLNEQIRTLKQSLKGTQDELESYRAKYFEADKNHALEAGKNHTLALHEIIKFVISTIFGGLGVNLISSKDYWNGFVLMFIGILFYGLVVFFDRKK